MDGLCVMLVGFCCGGWGCCLWSAVGVGVGNNILACCNTALMVLGICLYLLRNSSGVNMPIVSGF